MLREALTIESDMSSVPGVAAKLRTLFTAMGIPGGEAMVVEFCAVEAMENTIEHAYGGEPGHAVELVVSLDGASFTLEVIDRGALGSGLVIPPSLMDAVSYASADGVNTLTLSRTVHVCGAP